jgi:signal transduction histidine kinase
MPQSASHGLAAWPIRRKLIALVAVPILVIVAAGAWLTTSAVRGLREAERTRSLAISAMATNQATVALDEELTRTLIALSKPTKATRAALRDARTATDQRLTALNSQLDEAPSGGWSGDVLMAASSMKLSSTQLSTARKRADGGSRAPLVIETSFQSMFTALRNLTGALAREMSTSTVDGQAVDQASLLAALAAAAAAAADERATGTIAESENRLSELQLTGLRKLAVEQDVQLQIASSHATPEQQSDIDAIRMDDGRMKLFRNGLDDLQTTGATQDATAFSAATGQRLENLDELVGRVAVQARDTASTGVRNALFGTILLGGFTALVLLLIFATLAAIARTVTGPMRRLRSGAVEVATVRLPQAVRQIEQQGIDATIDLPPVMPPGTVAGPETIEVAHAVDGLTAEAVRLATAQVRLRHALDEAFVSMSRRSQTMVEKQLAIIDELESTEEDPEQLRNLFRLDHLAARMRRYNDNLLVLAGSSVRTRSNTPVPVSDVFRAATSEMEQYERVRLQPVSNATVAGPVAGGLIHLLAELLDNAAMYSPPTSPILLTAAFTPGGGLHLEVTDSGVGIPPAELAELNARLATPGTIDTQIPSRMGLFVVGRLAQRGGFEVRLSARASAAGTVAEVLVPATHVVGAPQGGTEIPPQSRIPAPQQRTSGPFSPQGLPAPGRPSPGASPAGPPSATPAAEVPSAPAPSPGLPRRPLPAWPGADQVTHDGTPGRKAAGPSTGGLPSRVPGAALSTGPLGSGPGGRNSPNPDFSPFDAFGASPADRPPVAGQVPPTGAAPIGPSSATAAWSSQARSARTGGTPARPGDNPVDRSAFNQPTGRGTPPTSAPGGSPSGLIPEGPGGPSRPVPGSPTGLVPGSPTGLVPGSPTGLVPGGPGGPSRPVPGGPGGPSGPVPGSPTGLVRSGGAQPGPATPEGSPLPTRTPSVPGSTPTVPPFSTRPAGPGSRGPALRPPGGTGSPGAPSPLTPTTREGDRDSGPGASPPRPTRPDLGDADPFATARLFGVEMPDPATAAGLFTAGPKADSPGTNRTEARPDGPDLASRGGRDRFGAGQPGSRLGGAGQPGSRLGGAGQPGPTQPGVDQRTAAVPERGGQDRPAGPAFPAARPTQPAGPGRQPGEGPPSGARGRPPADRDTPLTGELPALNLRPLADAPTTEGGAAGSGSKRIASAPWEGTLSTEESARSTATKRPALSDPGTPMIGNLDHAGTEASPIFEAMSAWFADLKSFADVKASPAAAETSFTPAEGRPAASGGNRDDRGELADRGDDLATTLPMTSGQPGETTSPATDRPVAAPAPALGKSSPQDGPRLIDLRDDRSAAASAPAASRWASLGDQQWLAANARAAAAPQVAGDTVAGLPRRQPGANLLPSATSAAPSAPPGAAPFPRADADAVRGRLGRFQRGVSSARQTTSHTGTTSTTEASLFTAARTADTDQGHEPDEQGGEQ